MADIRQKGDTLVATGTTQESAATTATDGQAVREPADRSFFAFGAGSYLVVVLVLVGAILARTHGRLVYTLDDAAIHLSIVNQLVHHGTWGVSTGSYQSASSSPVWTVLLAIGTFVLPFARNWLPLLFNVACGLLLLAVFSRAQQALRPSRQRRLDAVAVVVLVVVIMALPNLALMGMEHTLHAALMLSVIVWVAARLASRTARPPTWVLVALLAVAALTRPETAFVAGGLVLGLMAQCASGWRPDNATPDLARERIRLSGIIVAATGVPIALYALFNTAMGQGLLPNSVLAKGQGVGSESGGFAASRILMRFTDDPVLAVLALICIAYVVFAWRGRHRDHVVVAVTVAVASILQVVFAQSVWPGRYEAYLIVLGAFVVLQIAAEVRPEIRVRQVVAVPVLLLIALTLCVPKLRLLFNGPYAADNMYREQYQAGRFLNRYYNGRPIATDQLGYISLQHSGGLSDFAGLGDYEVLRARQRGATGKAYWADLAKRRGFKVAALYPESLLFDTPDNWILVGTWNMHVQRLTAIDEELEFWATTPDSVRPLEAQLREFAASMPNGETLKINSLAEFRADLLRKKQP